MSVLDRLAIAALPAIPRPVMRKLSARYIAGERLEDALARLEELRAQGFHGILDLLGEDVEDADAARRVAATYREAARAIAERGLDAYVSVKPTHLGLRLGEELCFELYDELAAAVGELGLFLRVEMEDHTTTDATLRVFERLRARHAHVGTVLQSRLLRTPADVRALADGRPLNVRMVKGVYLEPASIAHVDPDPIRDAYVACTRELLERGAFVGVATHDDALVERVLEVCRELGKGPEAYELQVLLGVRTPLWTAWRDRGLPVRVYVPYGPEWRPYSQRRLRKNPEIFRHVVRDVLGLSG